MRRALSIAGLLAAIALTGCGGDGGEESASCSSEPEGPTEDVVFRLLPGAEPVNPATRAQAMAFACRRLRAYDLAGRIEPAGPDRIKIVAEREAGGGEGELTPAQAVAASLGLSIYDWEANLIGSRRGYDSALEAARVASSQEPVDPCPRCASATPHYFRVWDWDVDPVATTTPSSTDGLTEVPVGTLLVTSGQGKLNERWYVLRDRAAVTGGEIAGARAGSDEVTGTPALFLDLTPAGQRSFRTMTKRVAARPGHFVVLFDSFEVATKPRLSPSVAAEGIDASKGVQITGIFEQSEEAEGAARLIDSGSPPVTLEPIRGSAGY
jgi:hypothetical protein